MGSEPGDNVAELDNADSASDPFVVDIDIVEGLLGR